MTLSNTTIRTRFVLLLGVFVLGFGLCAGWSFHTLNELKVNGPLYQRIVQSKDLVADVLPPPLYVLEPYLVTLQFADTSGAAEQAALRQRMEALRKDYDKRRQYWQQAQLEPDLARLILEQAHVPALQIFSLFESQLFPAVQRSDAAAVTAATAEIRRAYEAHRQVIDQVVVRVNERAARDEQDAERNIAQATGWALGMVLLSVLASIGVAVFIIRSITGPLTLAMGVADRVAEGDLTQNIEVRGRDETARLLGALRRMQDSLLHTVSTVRRNARQVAAASGEIATGNHDLSERTERQASALQETAASMEELDSTVKKNAANAHHAHGLADTASQVALKGSHVMGQVVSTMQGINDSSHRIADIIGVIDGIAFQTNILALNAAVEAARAGEQGRGFAVVASEVRNLAQRSAAAAKEINTLITDSVARVEDGSRLVGQAGRTMEEVVAAIQNVSTIVSEISVASAEQSAGVSQVGLAITQMDQVTQQNAALVEESAAAAQGLQAQAHDLVSAVSVFVLPSESVPNGLGRHVPAGLLA
ncbi:methyl-accepting chemotaxis protein [Curvibacter sp. HBC28]|uniref:Methyl-accepting chemotaxis protein n=1 Tax=Curvibacter microcysteis TaxID=3026419 RepID=A0ABT5MIJ8_9BURK|nr:methyl-accepting chemotaxis protein [Curvibacter sp. HBC28]MDD0814966.1 methyl-accepting chemotaxis protein [Curvibacter sp. HBC28]